MNGTRSETDTTNERAQASRGALKSQTVWGWLAAITILAACLRTIGINRGLWWDEIYFLIISVRHPLGEIITVFPGDTQHTLYSILARLSILTFGESAWSVRLPALVFGVASVPVLYLLARSVTTRFEALLSTTLLAVSYHHVWFSQNARGYSGLAFWTLLSTFYLLRGIRTGRRGYYIAYGVTAALGVYTHLSMIFLIASHVLICAGSVLAGWRQRLGSASWKYPLQGFLTAAGLSLLLYSPILIQVQTFFVSRRSPMTAVSTPRWALMEIFRGLVRGLGTQGVLVAAALVVGVGAWSYFKQSRVVFALFVLPGVLTALLSVFARGTMYPRFYFFLIGFAILILVRGVFVIPEWIGAHWPRRYSGIEPRPILTAILATILLVASAFALVRNYRYPKQDFEGAIQYVDTQKKTGETVVTAGAATYPLLNYYAKPWESVDTADELRKLCGRGRAVWVVYTFPRYLDDAAPPLMEMIRKDFTVVQVFHGTLGDGDVFVGKFEPGLT